jgi:hypothetical protein
MTRNQKIRMVRQACEDLMQCLDLLVQKYARSILDYAVWYREKHTESDTYCEYITLVCAHSIAHTKFLAPNVRWELVRFPHQ